MKLRSLLVVCCVLSLAGLAAAQTKKASDPISGTWSGSMGPTPARQTPITVTLKLDGNVVSGKITGPPNPGDLTGTFDQPTGALKFSVAVQDELKSVVFFEGKVVKDTASGSVVFKDKSQSGEFSMKRKSTEAKGAPPKD
jgi:hypothetical protein